MVRQARQLPYLNFQIRKSYLNQGGQSIPNHWLCLTWKFSVITFAFWKNIVRLRISIPRNKEKGLENLICNTVDKHINWTFTQDSQAFQHRVIKPHDYFAARRSQKLFQAKWWKKHVPLFPGTIHILRKHL